MSSAKKARIGLLTDIHYDGGAKAMNRLYEAVFALNADGVDAMVVMGDLIDGNSELHTKRLLREVSALCDTFSGPIHFMHGNHDLDHLSKAQFYNALGRVGDPSRFHFELGGYGFVCIDGNFSPGGTEYNCGNFQWQEAAVPGEQLDWLRGCLAASLLPAVVICHQRIDKECLHALRNHAEVRDMVSLSGKVKAVFQGHNHEDDLLQIDGTPYYTLGAHKDNAGPAVLQLDPKGIRLIRDFHPSCPAEASAKVDETA
jgi:predicted phosphodiesterase